MLSLPQRMGGAAVATPRSQASSVSGAHWHRHGPSVLAQAQWRAGPAGGGAHSMAMPLPLCVRSLLPLLRSLLRFTSQSEYTVTRSDS